MALSAVIDLGTNTFRLLIAEVTTDGIKQIYSESHIARLGEGFFQEKRFRPLAMERAMEILVSFKKGLSRYPIQHLSVVGTSAFREAYNRDDFLLSIKDTVGFSVEVIGGDVEAYYTFLGANLILQNSSTMLLVDIGGGSTEFVVAEGGTPKRMISTPLGVVSLTERHLRHDPTTPEECDALQKEITKTLLPLVTEIPKNALLAGTAGAVTTLAAMDQKITCYDPDKINGYRLSKAAISALFAELLPLSRDARCLIPGLKKGREDLIISGMMILLTLMELYHFDSVTVSDYGLREGVLIDRYRKEGERV